MDDAVEQQQQQQQQQDGGDAAAAAAPPPNNEQPQSAFDRAMEQLKANESNNNNTAFDLGSAVANDDEKLTILQAKALSEALGKSTVKEFTASIECCHIPAIQFLADYIRTSQDLKTLDANDKSDQSESDTAIQESYKSKLDRIFHAVRENPGIRKLTARALGNNPAAIYELLANTKSLTTFHTEVDHLSAEMSNSIAIGMNRNSSITNFLISVTGHPGRTNNLDHIISGLIASSVETVTLTFSHADESLWKAISNMIPLVSSLKHLDISHVSDTIPKHSVAKVLLDLRHPACSGLKTLRLQRVYLETGNNTNLTDIVPTGEGNSSLRSLSLNKACFHSPGAVRVLWNLIGLEELTIDFPSCSSLGDEKNDSYLAHWAEFIRRNKRLSKVELGIAMDSDFTLLFGVLEGARNHPKLKELKIYGNIDAETQVGGDVGARLSRLLAETPSLEQLNFYDIHFTRSCILLLAEGLCHNHSLRVLDIEDCTMEESRSITNILESLFVNETLSALYFEKTSIPQLLGLDFCRSLSQLLRNNKSLVNLMVSTADFRAGALSEALIGLKDNKTLTILSFDRCALDNEAIAALGLALESTTIALDELDLPQQYPGGMDAGAVKQGTGAFVKSLVHMPTIQVVEFGYTITELDDETRELLLRAVKENKNLCTLTFSCDNTTTSEDMAEIEYYLKLNRFGRRLLDSPNVPVSLWPRILSRMTTTPGDADALFFFLREYFSRQPAQKEKEPGQEPPQKKARTTSPT